MNELKEVTVKAFDIYDNTLDCALMDNLKTFEEAEAFIIAHDNKRHADWQLTTFREPERDEQFEHHQYTIYHTEGNIVAYADVLAKMSFEDLCEEAAGWRAISVVEFKF